MAVRIEFGADENIRTDDLADTRKKIAFGILVAGGDHRAMQAEHHGIDRHCCAQLVEDFVAQALIGQSD
jgi:hypothetical protein